MHLLRFAKVGLDPLMVSADLLHSWHLGIGRDVCGSIIKYLVMRRFWPARNQDERLAAASASLKTWAQQNELKLVIGRLTKPALN